MGPAQNAYATYRRVEYGADSNECHDGHLLHHKYGPGVCEELYGRGAHLLFRFVDRGRNPQLVGYFKHDIDHRVGADPVINDHFG